MRIRPRVIRCALLVASVVTMLSGLAGTALAAGPTAYVAEYYSNRVARLNLTTFASKPIPVGEGPVAIAITPNGTMAYVVNLISSTVRPINLVTGTTSHPISVPVDPYNIAIAPDGATAYVTTEWGVIPIDLSTNTAEAAIPVSGQTGAIAITPDGKTAYVANAGPGSGGVTPIDLATGTIGSPIALGDEVSGMAVAPDGRTLYLAVNPNYVTLVDVATNTVVSSLSVGGEGRQGFDAIAITPSGATAYITNMAANDVTPLNLTTDIAGSPIAVDKAPNGIAITPDGSTAYVTTSGGVTPINTAADTAGNPISQDGSGGDSAAIAVALSPVVMKVSCQHPSSAQNHEVAEGQSITLRCTALVKQPANATSPTLPSGTVSWSVSPSGTSQPAPCALPAAAGAPDACSVEVSTSTAGSYVVAAAYSGDANYALNSGTTSLAVK